MRMDEEVYSRMRRMDEDGRIQYRMRGMDEEVNSRMRRMRRKDKDG